MRVKGKRVFLSGPMSGLEHFNVDEFAKAHDVLRKAGASTVYDPAIEYLRSESVKDSERTHAYWMLRCIGELTSMTPMTPTNIFSIETQGKYDVLVSLPGWKRSRGARLERKVAKACGIDVCDLREVES